MNQTEWRVWDRLRGRKVGGWKFRRQHPIGPYFVDFCCPSARLVVEINGPAHDGDAQWAYDQRRTAWLEAQGYRVMRIIVEDVDEDLDGVIDGIYGELVSLNLPIPRLRRALPHKWGSDLIGLVATLF
jgi:very-short-patch-repair endonuclease